MNPIGALKRILRPPLAGYDAETVRVMERVLRRDSSCIDVGAAGGRILEEVVRIAPLGRHTAFEPLPSFHAKLERDFPSVQVVCAAVAATNGEAPFCHVVSNPAYSGLRERRYERAEQIEEITVRTVRLDDVTSGCDFIKIDVEGGEFDVLRGARNLLARCRPHIVFEFGVGAADWYGVKPGDVFQLLAAAGMQVSLMSAWLDGRAPLTEAHFAEEFERCGHYYFLAHGKIKA
jgi:FkbM family methyltransferase